MDKLFAVIPAAGIGTRMQSEVPKQYLPLQSRKVLDCTLKHFCRHREIDAVVVPLAEHDHWWSTLELADHEKIISTNGGEERCHSVLNGLRSLANMASSDDWVLVHDAARPCLRQADLDKLISTVRTAKHGGILALPVRDTMKRGDDSGYVLETVERTNLWHALTPQMFRLGELQDSIEHALQKKLLITDEASAMELSGHNVLLVEGHADNIKITHPQDLSLADLYLSNQEKS
ncbi:MAG: 2-C-methyl-D-erythritol 4-phosphate cytidylyltransferase [Gammaproteobacteria bacterium]|nr:2-C-methyl-D-erythritol 4-phosphate cytidylyltransferase [Gammaproteobacteria bacterium]